MRLTFPERADVYLLCGVLHDRSDDLALGHSRNCRNAMAKNGRLLIVETSYLFSLRRMSGQNSFTTFVSVS